MEISYQQEPELSPEEFVQVLKESTLAERRPVDDLPRIRQMLARADLIITARRAGILLGVARSISDGVYCTYLSDLAVSKNCQHQGIGKELIRLTKEATPHALLILVTIYKANQLSN